MRDDPYPARYYGRQTDEPFFSNVTLSPDNTQSAIHSPAHSLTHSFHQPLQRALVIVMALYICCALFLIFTVSSYAAPLGNATIPTQIATGCDRAHASRPAIANVSY